MSRHSKNAGTPLSDIKKDIINMLKPAELRDLKDWLDSHIIKQQTNVMNEKLTDYKWESTVPSREDDPVPRD